MKIAIVGAGISGLTCAHLLHPRHEITMFEANAYAGGHTNTVRVDTAHETLDVDTGFIVYNDRNYPRFERLLKVLGVATQPSTMSFSVSDGKGDFEYSGASANGLFANRRHLARPAFHRMILDLMRFNREAPALVGLNGDGPSLGSFLEDGGYSRNFVERLIVPQASAVWSADPRQMWSFPASLLAEFFANHGMFGQTRRPNWRTITGGARNYVEAIVGPLGDRARLSTPVRRVERLSDGVELTVDGREPERFDEVVIAAHSDQALAMLADPSDAERELLGAIPYQRNDAVLHTDERMLPRRRRAWASWNYHLQDEPTGRSTVTYHMNRLQSLDTSSQICVTLNRIEDIDPERVIETIPYDHPVYTHAGLAAQRRWDEISGRNRTHYCGAYWGYGFHEDGVASAARVCERLGGAGMSSSAIYEGSVRHRRHVPVEHAFRYRVFMMYLDLDELPGLFDGVPLWSARRPAPARFRRPDFLGDPSVPLRQAVLDEVERQQARRPAGPVRLLANLRYLGHSFNPVSFYFCFAPDGERVDAVLAEVTNTPWGERHAYLLERGRADGRVLHDKFDKAFHVSPFIGMDHSYEWHVAEPGQTLQVHIENHSQGERAFDATLSLERREATPAALRRVLLRYPAMSLQVVTRIYLNALRLKLKGAPYHPHPAR